MIRNALSIGLLAGIALSMGACAMPAPQAVDWNRPFQPVASGEPPVFLHDMAIQNPPHPAVVYADYTEEPSRFQFRPRNIVYFDDEPQDAGAGMDEGFADFGFEGGGGGGGE